jgi:hypothetical protein
MRCRASRRRTAFGPTSAVLQTKRTPPGKGRSAPDISLGNVPAHGATGESSGTRLPDRLKAGIEALAGVAMDDVRVHRDSAEPLGLGALAYARGDQIHLGPGQDRHLPHEAWHVAQQKQGRVEAKGGTAVNADPALEAEADRMGAAASGPAAGAGRGAPRAARGRPGVIQPKVMDGGSWLQETDPMSPTLLGFVKKTEPYRLRDDFHGNLAAEPVHLMDMSKKYLLGETHGDAATAKWNAATQYWSQVGKMFEWTKALPSRERREVGMPAANPQDQPLESRHAYTLINVLQAQDRLNVLSASWVRDYWSGPGFKATVRSIVTDAREALSSVDFAKYEYGSFLTAFDATLVHSKRSRMVQIFALEFRDVYEPAIAALDGFLQAAAEAIGASDMPKADAAAIDLKFKKALDDIAANRAFLVRMAAGLIGLTGAAGEELERLGSLLRPTDQGQALEALNAPDAARERAMAENIAGAEAPLLVKVGESHVDDLKGLVWPSAVAVHENQNLEDLTRQPPGP